MIPDIEWLPNERWTEVVGYEGLYKISDHGRVWAYPRVVQRRFASGIFESNRKSTLMKPKPIIKGYIQASLTDPEGNHNKEFVHRLVAKAFLPKPEEGQDVVMHLDDNPANNHYTNLQWGTHSDNMRDCASKGRNRYIHKQGEATANAFLTEEQVLLIRDLVESGISQTDLAKRFNVTKQNIHQIVHRKSWSHI